jgi:hypothetical protein
MSSDFLKIIFGGGLLGKHKKGSLIIRLPLGGVMIILLR